jgi:hypothetical protein
MLIEMGIDDICGFYGDLIGTHWINRNFMAINGGLMVINGDFVAIEWGFYGI